MIELEPNQTKVTYELQNPIIRSTWIGGKKTIRIIALRVPTFRDCMHITMPVKQTDMAQVIANVSGLPIDAILDLEMKDFIKLSELVNNMMMGRI